MFTKARAETGPYFLFLSLVGWFSLFGSPTKHIAVWSYVGSLTLYGYQALSLCPMQHLNTCNLGIRNGRCPSRANSCSGANSFLCIHVLCLFQVLESFCYSPASWTIVWYSVQQSFSRWIHATFLWTSNPLRCQQSRSLLIYFKEFLFREIGNLVFGG